MNKEPISPSMQDVESQVVGRRVYNIGMALEQPAV